jgi:hypothetical protein
MLFHDSPLSARSCIKFLGCLTLFFGFTMIVPAQDNHPPQILEIYRDYLKPDSVAENRKLERRAEHLCRTLGFSDPYLTIESVSGPAEMCYFNGFDTQAEVAGNPLEALRLDSLKGGDGLNAPLRFQCAVRLH